jgi:hypothetical protein
MYQKYAKTQFHKKRIQWEPMRGRKRDLGMDPHTDSADTNNGPEEDTYGLARLPLLQNLVPTTPSGNLVVSGAYGFLSSEPT